MKLFDKIRLNRAKRQVIKCLKIIDKLSWEELDSIIPRTDYKDCFKNYNWTDVKIAFPKNPFNDPCLERISKSLTADFCLHGERKDT